MASKSEKTLYVDVDHIKYETTFWLHSERNGKRDVISYDGTNTVATTISEGCSTENHKPLLRLPKPIADELIELIAKYAQQSGIATESESETKGKLIATEIHLSDMREISKQMLQIIANAK